MSRSTDHITMGNGMRLQCMHCGVTLAALEMEEQAHELAWYITVERQAERRRQELPSP